MNAARILLESDDNISGAEFARIAEFTLRISGIALPPSKQVMVEGRLRRRSRELGFERLSDYVAFVLDGVGGPAEADHLIDALTTNKTDFFREPAHFDALADRLLPELADRRRAIKIWSAASSIGAEPYSIAMVVSEFLKTRPDAEISILASDISNEVLAAAERAVFSAEMIEPIPPAMRRAYLMRARDPKRAEYRIVPELRAMVQFARINLVESHYPVSPDFDVIFCRNLLIYFKRPTQEAVIKRLASHLRPGGYLVLGHTDSVVGMNVPLEGCGGAIFRRR